MVFGTMNRKETFMKFQINGRQFRSRFSYLDNNGHFGGAVLKNSHQHPVTTTCEIQKLDENNEWQRIGLGKTTCSVRDNFNKKTGRKTALTRALQDAKDYITREQRKEAWYAYFEQHADNKPDWYYEEEKRTMDEILDPSTSNELKGSSFRQRFAKMIGL